MLTAKRVVITAVAALSLSPCGAVEGSRYPPELDRSREGEAIPEYEIATMRGEIAVFTTIDVRSLDPPQVSMMGRVFRVRPAAIRQFRWGPSMAPVGHPLADTAWYTIWYDDEYRTDQANMTLRVDGKRKIIEKAEW